MCTYSDTNVNWFSHLNRLDNQGYMNGTQRTYAYASTGADVRAYVVDTGVYGTHQEFDTRVEGGANMTVDADLANGQTRPDEEQPITLDDSPANNPCWGYQATLTNAAHGTAVASALGGTNTGVAKNVTIIPVKVMTCGGQLPKLAVARGLDWIQEDMADADHNPLNGLQPRTQRAVVNMSIFFRLGVGIPAQETQVCEDGDVDQNGLPTYTNCISAIENEINELVRVDLNVTPARRGIPVVVSANNQSDGNCTTSPARLGYGGTQPTAYHTITVGGTMAFPQNNYSDARWLCDGTPEGCSTDWPDRGSNFGPCVSMYAPAWNIRTASGTGWNQYRPDGAASSGTSFAAPQVAGAIARLFERQPNLTSVEVWNELLTRMNERWWNTPPPNFDPSGTNSRLLYMRYNE